MQRKVAGKFRMSSLLACNAKHGFLYLAYQHKEVTRMTFAEKLKSIRKKAGLSQEQLAEKLGVSRQAGKKMGKVKRNPAN